MNDGTTNFIKQFFYPIHLNHLNARDDEGVYYKIKIPNESRFTVPLQKKEHPQRLNFMIHI